MTYPQIPVLYLPYLPDTPWDWIIYADQMDARSVKMSLPESSVMSCRPIARRIVGAPVHAPPPPWEASEGAIHPAPSGEEPGGRGGRVRGGRARRGRGDGGCLRFLDSAHVRSVKEEIWTKRVNEM